MLNQKEEEFYFLKVELKKINANHYEISKENLRIEYLIEDTKYALSQAEHNNIEINSSIETIS